MMQINTRQMSLAGLLIAFSAPNAASQSEVINGISLPMPYNFASNGAAVFRQWSEYPVSISKQHDAKSAIAAFCEGLGEGEVDIIFLDRKITSSDFEICEQNGISDLKGILLGRTAISVAKHLNVPSFNFTPMQLRQAIAADVSMDGNLVANPYTNWSEIDGSLPDVEIKVFGPPANSPTHSAFVKLVMEYGCIEADGTSGFASDYAREDCIKTREDGRYLIASSDRILEAIARDPGALAIVDFYFLAQNQNILKGSSISGVNPTEDSIKSGKYPLSQASYAYVKGLHIGVIPGLADFVTTIEQESCRKGCDDRESGVSHSCEQNSLIAASEKDCCSGPTASCAFFVEPN